MNVLFHPDAELEFNEAIGYYEAIENGLGYDFSLEIAATLARVVAFPKAWPTIEGEIRRALARRFPYGILYAEDEDNVSVVAVMHLHRDPTYWKYRI
ncbi:type II toxin-antitoxin system RelE/ParE family toxin [Crenothrix sp.]|uniref:type II toxin-antitoxin system RelE/ParE family toxin n=1 Tax=Crenothrix sp. TaxID=3100433 RepID=UPI00374CC189